MLPLGSMHGYDSDAIGNAMCFVLHLASPVPLPMVPWDENHRSFNVGPVAEWGRDALVHLTLLHVYELGSDKCCACGFRNASYQGGSWPWESWRPDDDTEDVEAQPNHEQMVAFLRAHLPKESVFELHGGWNGELGEACCSDQQILLSRLLELDFFFRHRGRYTVTVD